MSSRQVYMQVMPVSPMVKRLIVINIGIWFFVQLILENIFLSQGYFTAFFSFTPRDTLENFFLWQPFTYMFLHSRSIFHVLLNMISLWFFGSELEYRWGSKSFLYYYLICGVGAAFVYLMGILIVGLFQEGQPLAYNFPVLGASGAVFGILLAYGILFGSRIIYFFGIFPMTAKVFVMIIGGIELVSLLNDGVDGSRVANLAHIGGLLSGYLYLLLWTRFQQRHWKKRKRVKTGHRLKLVINKEENSDDKKNNPRYWN